MEAMLKEAERINSFVPEVSTPLKKVVIQSDSNVGNCCSNNIQKEYIFN